MSWAEDTAKLERVRALMADEDLDALVVRSPDNVLYLSNYWGMKGYDAVVFPREGKPTLICLDPQLEEAQRMSWTDDILTFGGYDAARYVHFFAMAAIVGFLVVHIVTALLVPKALRAMITGR